MKKTPKKSVKKAPQKISTKAVKKAVVKTLKKSSSKMVVKVIQPLVPIRPLGNRVVIRPFTKEELESKAGANNFGIILPTSGSKEKSEQGTVLAVGPGVYQDGTLVPVALSVGDVVVFSKYGYEDVTVGGEELYIIKEDSVLAVLK